MMWTHYVKNKLYENPVEIAEFFSEFQAIFGYFYVLVNQYKQVVDQEIADKTSLFIDKYAGASATERVDSIRRMEKAKRVKLDYYMGQVSWAKLCINAMQTILRLAGDEAKMNLK